MHRYCGPPLMLDHCDYPHLRTVSLTVDLWIPFAHAPRILSPVIMHCRGFPALQKLSVGSQSKESLVDFASHPTPLQEVNLEKFSGTFIPPKLPIGRLEINPEFLDCPVACAILPSTKKLAFHFNAAKDLHSLQSKLSGEPLSDERPLSSSVLCYLSLSFVSLDIFNVVRGIPMKFGAFSALKDAFFSGINMALRSADFPKLVTLTLSDCVPTMIGEFTSLATMSLQSSSLPDGFVLQAPNLIKLSFYSVKNAQAVAVARSLFPNLHSLEVSIFLVPGDDISRYQEWMPRIETGFFGCHERISGIDGCNGPLVTADLTVQREMFRKMMEDDVRPCPKASCPVHGSR